jgi:hypothetical protein
MPRGTSEAYRALEVAAQEFALSAPRRPTATELREHLAALTEDLPDDRTLRRWINRARPADTSDDWSLIAADSADARFVLPVLGWRWTAKQEPLMTVALARWVVRVGRARPGIAPEIANDFAMRYLAAEVSGSKPVMQATDVMLGVEAWLATSRIAQGTGTAVTEAQQHIDLEKGTRT